MRRSRCIGDDIANGHRKTAKKCLVISDGQAALAAIQSHAPDVAVLDIDMPGLDGFGVVRALSTLPTRPQVIFLTMHGEQELFEAALELGI